MILTPLLLAAAVGSWPAGSAPKGSEAAAASAAAAAAFREGCEQGSLKLTPERGRVLKDSEAAEYVDALSWGRAVTQRTVVVFTYPPSTYMAIAQFRDVQPKGIARICVLVSKVLTDADASRALIETTPEIPPRQTWVPDMLVPEWTVDVPKQGYRKRMAVRHDGSTLLEVATYASDPSTPPPQARQP
jgi:hypothetical protein